MKMIIEIRRERNRLTKMIYRLNLKADKPEGLSMEEYEVLDEACGARDALNWVLKNTHVDKIQAHLPQLNRVIVGKYLSDAKKRIGMRNGQYIPRNDLPKYKQTQYDFIQAMLEDLVAGRFDTK